MFTLVSMTAMQPNSSTNEPGAASAGNGEAWSEDPAQFLTELQLRDLAEMRAAGMDFIRDLKRQTLNPDDEKVRDPSAAFARLSQAIRRIIALEQETMGLREKRKAHLHITQVREKKAAVYSEVRKAAKAAGKPDVERLPFERLLGDLFSDYNDYAKGSVAEIVSDLGRKLNVPFNAAVWEPGAKAAEKPAPETAKAVAEKPKPSPVPTSKVARFGATAPVQPTWKPGDKLTNIKWGPDPPK
jgi:hypothetical protein